MTKVNSIAELRRMTAGSDVELPEDLPTHTRSRLPTPAESPLEARFLAMWMQLGGPELEREFRFHPDRQWRADFYHADSRTIIECEGGVYSQGRHTRGAGFIEDCRKYNAATLLGYTVFRLTSEMIQPDEIEAIIQHCRGER